MDMDVPSIVSFVCLFIHMPLPCYLVLTTVFILLNDHNQCLTIKNL